MSIQACVHAAYSQDLAVPLPISLSALGRTLGYGVVNTQSAVGVAEYVSRLGDCTRCPRYRGCTE